MPSLRGCNETIKQDIDAPEELKEEVKPKLEVGNEDWLNGAEASQLLKQTMDGFLLVLSSDGDITYVSENVVEYLGISKVGVFPETRSYPLTFLFLSGRLTVWVSRSGSTRTSATTPRSRRPSA